MKDLRRRCQRVDCAGWVLLASLSDARRYCCDGCERLDEAEAALAAKQAREARQLVLDLRMEWPREYGRITRIDAFARRG